MDELIQTSRQVLLQEVRHSFEEADYKTTEVLQRSSTFDIIAKEAEENNPILTKVLKNLDNFKIYHSQKMDLLSKLLGATPLLIAQYYKNKYKLRDKTVYNRHGLIPVINLKTLKVLLKEHIPPHKIAVRGSADRVRINSHKLTQYFHKTGRTITQLSSDLSISRQSLLNYQKTPTPTLRQLNFSVKTRNEHSLP